MAFDHFSALATLSWRPFTAVPKVATVPAMTMEMPDAMIAYPIALVPRSAGSGR